MKTEWDYSSLADAYLERPPYAEGALKKLFDMAGLSDGDKVCDIGAGVAHLTLPLLAAGFKVVAVEPNDAMRANGMKRTEKSANVEWVEAGGEDTGLPGGHFDFVTFGSSFNVVDRQKAMAETHRLLKPGRFFTCLWNHRDLSDPVQKKIEEIIAANIPGYDYGVRREDQSAILTASPLFTEVQKVEGQLIFPQPIAKTVEAWRSHATLERQAKDKFGAVVDEIEKYLKSLARDTIDIPYTTRAWIAKRVG
jgi:ubiquinone/menaquinone biosynthesis C-methylase UbiE